MVAHHAPPPVALGSGKQAVAVDVTSIHAAVRLNVAHQRADADATVRFRVDGAGGCPAIDLRQPVTSLRLDGVPLPPEAWEPTDLGGGPGAHTRVLDADVEPGSDHVLEVGYPLGVPAADGAVAIDWRDGGVRWDLWMSDLRPGRYLEMWIPAPLCHDRFALSVDLEVAGTDRPHAVVTNGWQSAGTDGRVSGLTGAGAAGPGSRWRITYPPHFTTLSPMLVLCPADELERSQDAVRMEGTPSPLALHCARHAEVDADLEACAADVKAWLAYLAARYGPWAHGDTMTVFVWGPGRGMEYDGATTASVAALEHEVFHSWFGRGVKPACAADGWIDEAWTSWSTATHRSEGPRYGAEALGDDMDPVELYPPQPWARHTPVEAYTAGARLFSGVAHALGGAPQLRSAMAAWYRANAGRLITTDGLEAHLRELGGDAISAMWSRYVHGRG